MIRKLWTDEKPKQSGWYWLKTEDGAEVVLVKRGRVFTNVATEPERQMIGVKVEEVTGKWHGPVPFPSLHRANKYEQGLKDLTLVAIDCLAALDCVMEQRESPERGSQVARIANHLNSANDAAMHFALGMDFDSMAALKRKRERMRAKAQANGK